MPARALALLLVVLMTPAAAEVIETGVHLVAHGDLGHLADQDHTPPGGDEHGCSAVLHLCGCHASSSIPVVTAARERIPRAERRPVTLGPLDRLGRDTPPPPIRPPIV